MSTRIGVMGGSGLYEIEGLHDIQEVRMDTPFGPPSDAFITGKLGDIEMVFLPRHGRGHVLNPSEVPYRANIWGMKRLGTIALMHPECRPNLRTTVLTAINLPSFVCHAVA